MSVHGARRVSALEANDALATGSSKTDGVASPATPNEPRSPSSAPGSSASASSAQVSPLLDLASIERPCAPGLSRRDLSDAFSEADQRGAAAAAAASPPRQQRGAAADTDEARSSGASPHAQTADSGDEEADAAAAPTVHGSAASAAADIYDHLARPDRLRVGDFVVTLEPMSLLARVTAIEENGLWVRTFQVSVPHFYFSHQLRCLTPIANDEEARLTAGVVHALWRSDAELSWSSYLPVVWDERSDGDRFRSATDGTWEANLGFELMTDAPQSLQLPMSKNHWVFPPFCSLQSIDEETLRRAAQSAPRGKTGRSADSVRRLATTAQAIDAAKVAAACAPQWSHLGRRGHVVVGSLVLNQEAAACEVMEIKEDGMLLWPLVCKEGGRFIPRPPAALCPFASISLILPVLEEQLLAKPALLGVFTLYSHDGYQDSNAWNGAYYPASYSCMKQKKIKADQEGGVENDKKEFNITYAHEQCVKTTIALEPQQLREDNHARVVPAFCFTRPLLPSELDAPPAAAAAASSSPSIRRPASESVAHGTAEPNRNQSTARALASQAPSGAGAAAAGGPHDRAASPQNAAARVEAAPATAAAVPPSAAALAASASEPMDIDAGDDDDWSGSAEGEQKQPDGTAATAARTATVASPATLSQRPGVTTATTVPARVGGAAAASGPTRSSSPFALANSLQPACAADMVPRVANAAAAAGGLGVAVADRNESPAGNAAAPSSSLSDLLSLQAASVRALELRLVAALKQVEEHGQEKSSLQRQLVAQTSLASQKTAEAELMRAEHAESLAAQQREADDLRRQLTETHSRHTAELQARDAQLAAREAQLIELERKQTDLHADAANAKARVLRLQSRSTEDSIRLRELEEQAADAAAASRRVAELQSKRRAETELQEETKRQRGAGAGSAE